MATKELLLGGSLIQRARFGTMKKISSQESIWRGRGINVTQAVSFAPKPHFDVSRVAKTGDGRAGGTLIEQAAHTRSRRAFDAMLEHPQLSNRNRWYRVIVTACRTGTENLRVLLKVRPSRADFGRFCIRGNGPGQEQTEFRIPDRTARLSWQKI